MIFGRTAFGLVTIDHILFHRVCDLNTVGVASQTGPLHDPGVFGCRAFFYRELIGIGFRDIHAVGLEGQHSLKLINRRALAQHIAVVVPYLCDLDVRQTKGVGK